MAPRLTVEDLKYLVPIFQSADLFYEANAPLINKLNRGEVETAYKLREKVLDKILKLSTPLLASELRKMIGSSHLKKDDQGLFDLLFYAARGGALRGLRHFDVERLDKSATNYLFMWMKTYATKELNALEAAPFGISPVRFNSFKKISAVRKKLTEAMDRPATNQEIFEFFQSGAADLKTMTGRKGATGPSKSNQRITLEQIADQEYFEKKLITQNLIDPQDPQANRLFYGEVTHEAFDETLFGTFLKTYDFTPEAKVSLMSDLQVDPGPEGLELLKSLPPLEVKRLSYKWKALLRDKDGLFADFLRSVKEDGFKELDIPRTLKVMEEQPPIKRSQWQDLLNVPQGVEQ